MHEISYTGKELELFQYATVWKKYFGHFIKPYLKETVLEVGAGIGSTTKYLCDGTQKKWICLEPDADLFFQLNKKIKERELPDCCRAIQGTIRDLPPAERFNSILYVDVIEHIENDREELTRAEKFLPEDGFLVVLVPAYQSVYSAFD